MTISFGGWKPIDGWRQWSACTVESAFDPPDVRYYNWDNYTHQKTNQAEDAYSETILCIGIPSLRADECCSYMNGRNVTFSGSYMSVYEIDPVDEDEFIKTLYYPNLQRSMSGCTLDDCPSQASSWYNVSSWYPSSGGQVLNAQIRFVVEGCVAVDEQCP